MPTLLVHSFLSGVDSRARAEGGVRSGCHGNCQRPVPLSAEHPLSSPWQRWGPVSWGTRGSAGGNVSRWEGGRERANKFGENTVIQYGRHCVPARRRGGGVKMWCHRRLFIWRPVGFWWMFQSWLINRRFMMAIFYCVTATDCDIWQNQSHHSFRMVPILIRMLCLTIYRMFPFQTLTLTVLCNS